MKLSMQLASLEWPQSAKTLRIDLGIDACYVTIKLRDMTTLGAAAARRFSIKSAARGIKRDFTSSI